MRERKIENIKQNERHLNSRIFEKMKRTGLCDKQESKEAIYTDRQTDRHTDNDTGMHACNMQQILLHEILWLLQAWRHLLHFETCSVDVSPLFYYLMSILLVIH